jgi:ATP-dependent DNA helicase PIF1
MFQPSVYHAGTVRDLPQEDSNMDIKLSVEQETLFTVMEKTKQHLFITGRAGAGKSVLLRHFRENTKKRAVVAAPTGIAALNIKGQTLHSLFRLAPNLHRHGKLAPNARVCSLLKRVETLVIDEISMVRADLLDAVDERLREAHKNDLPFGGVQIIMFGDVYQLPPVVEPDLMQYFEAVHHGYFFFHALVWKQAEFKIYELTQVFRQKDPVFKDILNAVRDGTVTDSQIEALNTRYGASPAGDETVTLAPTNALVTEINQKRLDQLEGKARQYTATITGEMKKSTFPTEENLWLKKGAQIVMLKNDKDGRWVNGTVGKIEALFDDHIDVRISGIVYTLERETWEEVTYTYDLETQKIEMKVASSFTQYPIRLAWALTIHKSQGQTYQNVMLDLTTATFAPGQMYVALSRCTSMEGLSLKMPVKRKDIIVDAKVTAFMAKRETIKVEEVEPEEVTPVSVAMLPEQAIVSDVLHEEITALAPASVQFHHDGNEEGIIQVSKERKQEPGQEEQKAKRGRGRPKKAGDTGTIRDRVNISLDVDVIRFLRSQKNYSELIESLIQGLPEYDDFLKK